MRTRIIARVMVKRKMAKKILIPGQISFIIFASAMWISDIDFGPDI